MATRAELRAPARRVTRLIALSHLADAVSARARLDDPDDAEALHDFRVALRRLRSWERAFRAFLKDGIRPRLRDRVRDLARATGTSRDAEVHLAWLSEQNDLRARDRSGLNWLRARFEHERASADRDLRERIEQDFVPLRRKLERQLARYRESVSVHDETDDRPSFADALAPRIRDLARELRAHLQLVGSMADESEAHQARIAGKRLRYLLEPVADELPRAKAIVARLKTLQDVVGDLHDAQLFARAVGEAARDAGAEYAASIISKSVGQATNAAVAPAARIVTPRVKRRDPTPGLAELARRLHARADDRFDTFAAEWLGDTSASFFEDVERLGEEVSEIATNARGDASRDLEIERKYLLRELPAKAKRAPSRLIEQGYLPGERLHERVRRVSDRGDDGTKRERYYRTIKLGSGISRTEIEEEIARALFTGLWRLTKGRRVRKRRYVVANGDREWEIDEFLDRDLVLAELELDSAAEEVEIPEWLAPAIEREVTEEPAYLNLNLAR